MLYLSLVGTYRASDVCQGGNVIPCEIPVNLDHNGVAYSEEEKKKADFLVEHDIGKILIINLRSITNCLFEVLFHSKDQ